MDISPKVHDGQKENDTMCTIPDEEKLPHLSQALQFRDMQI